MSEQLSAQQRVTFRFARDMVVRYLARLPEPGDLTMHFNKPWIVTSVQSNAAGIEVSCNLTPSSDGFREN